jgi:hypothetical protein
MAEPIAVEFDGLRAFLMQQPHVRDAVVDGDKVRIYPAVLPQAGKYPALTYQLVTDLPQHHVAGRSSLEFARVQLGVYDTEYKPARRLAAHVVNAVSGFRGMMGTVQVYESTVEGPRHFFLADLKLHELQLDVLLWFKAI